MKRRSIHSMIKEKLKLNHVTNKNKEDKHINRSSSQRLSLFKYPHVEVETSSNDYMTTTKSNGSGKLLARGPIEIYEMRTISSRSFFLSVGRHGEWIHPMLPKLKIRRVVNVEEFNLFVSFSNPDRIWKIKFIECDELTVDNEMIQNLESVITGICQYSCVKSLKQESSPQQENEDTDELNYLLESSESEDEDGELTDVEIDDSINDAFKRAMNNVIPPWQPLALSTQDTLTVRKIRQDPIVTTTNKRMSLYIPNTTTTTTFDHKILNRRSISVFSDYETLISLQDLKL